MYVCVRLQHKSIFLPEGHGQKFSNRYRTGSQYSAPAHRSPRSLYSSEWDSSIQAGYWTCKMWSIHTTEYYLDMNEWSTDTWYNVDKPEIVMPSDRNLMQKPPVV